MLHTLDKEQSSDPSSFRLRSANIPPSGLPGRQHHKPQDHHTNPSFPGLAFHFHLQHTEHWNHGAGDKELKLRNVALEKMSCKRWVFRKNTRNDFACLSSIYGKEAGMIFFFFNQNHIFTKPIKFKTRSSKSIQLKRALMRGFSNPSSILWLVLIAVYFKTLIVCYFLY